MTYDKQTLMQYIVHSIKLFPMLFMMQSKWNLEKEFLKFFLIIGLRYLLHLEKLAYMRKKTFSGSFWRMMRKFNDEICTRAHRQIKQKVFQRSIYLLSTTTTKIRIYLNKPYDVKWVYNPKTDRRPFFYFFLSSLQQ